MYDYAMHVNADKWLMCMLCGACDELCIIVYANVWLQNSEEYKWMGWWGGRAEQRLTGGAGILAEEGKKEASVT